MSLQFNYCTCKTFFELSSFFNSYCLLLVGISPICLDYPVYIQYEDSRVARLYILLCSIPYRPPLIEWDLLPFGLNRGSDADMRINYNDDLSNYDFSFLKTRNKLLVGYNLLKLILSKKSLYPMYTRLTRIQYMPLGIRKPSSTVIEIKRVILLFHSNDLNYFNCSSFGHS